MAVASILFFHHGDIFGSKLAENIEKDRVREQYRVFLSVLDVIILLARGANGTVKCPF